MRYFDLHCDTIIRCQNKQRTLRENDFHISLKAAEGLDSWCQMFAIFIPDGNGGAAAQKYYEDALAYFRQDIADNSDRISFCVNSADIRETLPSGRCAALLAIENAAVLGGECGYLEKLHRDGVWAITLTWNGANEVGNGVMSGNAAGLTAFGKDLLLEMEKYGIAADVSHLNQAGFWDVLQSRTPVIATHSNAAGVWGHPRSLDDDQIRGLIDRKGLMGLCFCRDFLGDGENCGQEAVLRQVEHVLELGGEDILSIGSDFDGGPMHPELDGVVHIKPLYEHLAGHGIDLATLDKVFFRNAFDFYQRLHG